MLARLQGRAAAAERIYRTADRITTRIRLPEPGKLTAEPAEPPARIAVDSKPAGRLQRLCARFGAGWSKAYSLAGEFWPVLAAAAYIAGWLRGFGLNH